MKKYVYTLWFAKVDEPFTESFPQNFDSVDALLSHLIYTAKLHGYKYPSAELLRLASSINIHSAPVDIVATFYTDGGIKLPAKCYATYIPCTVYKRPLLERKDINVNLETIAEVSA
jgi:hypothetical protein